MEVVGTWLLWWCSGGGEGKLVFLVKIVILSGVAVCVYMCLLNCGIFSLSSFSFSNPRKMPKERIFAQIWTHNEKLT